MADDFGVYDLTGRLELLASSSLEVALQPPSGNLNLRRKPARDLRDLQEMNSEANLVTGRRDVFVLSEVSSSQHEVTSRNAFFSGTAALENTAVPATGSFYYSKQSKLVQLTYKLSASAGMSVVPGNQRSPSTVENVARGTFDAVSGSYRNNNFWDPAVFEIDVPEYGKIRNLRVWVELVHDIRSGPGTISAGSVWGGTGDANPNRRQGLQGLQVALRSPNSDFPFAHPLWNDRQVRDNRKNPDAALPEMFKAVPDLLKNSYLLWAGHSVEQDLGQTLKNATSSLPDSYFDSATVTTGSGMFQLDETRELSIDTDYLGRPHIAFLQEATGGFTDYRIRYGRFTSTGWKFHDVDTADERTWIRIRVTKSGQPRIAYFKPFDEVRFAYSDDLGATWTVETVTTIAVDLMSNCDMVLDSNDVPHVAFTHDAENGVFHARRVGASDWKIETVEEGPFGFVEDGLAIGIDSQDRPHVTYSAAGAPSGQELLNYAFSGSNGWERQILPFPAAFPQDHSSLVVDLNDNIHILVAYDRSFVSAPAEHNRVTHFFSGSSGWISSSITFDGVDNVDVGQTQVALDRTTGDVGLLWRNVDTTDFSSSVRYARLGEDGLSNYIVAGPSRFNSAQSMGHPALAYDLYGNEHIVYIESRFGNVKHAYRAGAVQTQAGVNRIIKGLGASASLYYSFDTDIDMRTVFTDSSPNANPRHMRHLYDRELRTSLSPGNSLLMAGRYPSPSSASLLAHFKYPRAVPKIETPHFLSGANFPWMLDNRIPPGNFYGRNYSTATASDGNVVSTSSFPVPSGWLTGPGGTANTNEWPTKGMSLGPNDIRPVYPLLDDVFVEKVFDEPSRTDVSTVPSSHGKIIGFRPGLRGTEVHGKWKLLIGNNAHFDGSVGMTGSIRDGWWFRQFRLEFLVDQGEEAQDGSYPSKSKRFKKHATVVSRPGQRIHEVVSGSAAWDIGVNHVFVVQPDEYGRSIGIVDETESNDFAVFSQLTGAFVDALSGSGLLESVQATYLANEFGTPYVPISSGSGELPSFDTFDVEEAQASRDVFTQVLNPQTLVPQDNTLRAHISRAGVLETTRNSILKKILDG